MAKHFATSLISLAFAATSVNAHAFFHEAYVNGASKGNLFGVRAPASNSPIQDVTSSAITCNSPLHSPVSTDVIEVAPGDKFGLQWNHNINGPTAGDADDPIAASHKGPVMVYMAKVDDASSNDGAGLSWFKVAEEGLDTTTGKWGVDTLIANAGLWSFTMPSLAAGDYLLRGEIIALHSAGSTGEAQFYMSCAGVRVTGSGTCSPTDTVSFPGAYSASDPGILISIYGNDGKPTNGGKAYTIPGPSVATCDGSSSGGSTSSSSVSVSASVTTAQNAATTSSAAATTTTAASSDVTSVEATSAASTTVKPSSVRPTTFSTVTGSRPAANATRPWESWTWSRPAHSTRTHASQSVRPSTTASFTLSASGLPETTATGVEATSTAEDDSEATECPAVDVTATETGGVKLPATSEPTSTATRVADTSKAGSVTATATTTTEATASVTGTSPATPSQTGYQMTGPGGRKFMCYEVTDF